MPLLRSRTERAPTDARHCFKVHTTPVPLKIQLMKGGEPRAGTPFVIVIDGVTRTGATDDDGRLECWVPANAIAGVLTIENDEYRVLLRHLDPVESAVGVRQRLANLGFYKGPLEGASAAELRAAIVAFQRSEQGLEYSGEMDSKTLEALERRHSRD